MKKYSSTQELVNFFPGWARIREDQSVGRQFFNTIGGPMDGMQESLRKMRSNQYLLTANIDEIDLTYKITLPVAFEFGEDTSDPLVYCPIAPTVSGQMDSVWYEVVINGDNNVEDFWYKSIPSRATFNNVVSGIDEVVTAFRTTQSPVELILDHHLGGGRLWIETTSGIQYLTIENGELRRAKIQITGTTRKGTDETETIVFPWNMKQPTRLEWSTITSIRAFNIEDDVAITIKSGDFNNGPYMDFFNLSYSPGRRKIDTFWDLETVSGVSQFNKMEYINDDWESLTLGFSDVHTVETWDLLDAGSNPIYCIDMAVQPFTNRAWMTTTSGIVHCYDLHDELPDMSLIKDRTPGSHVIFETDAESVTLGDAIVVTPWHARPLKEIKEYRIWYQTPAGVKYGLYYGDPVAFTSDFIIKGAQLTQRTIEDDITVIATEYGDYLFVLEATFVDDEEHTEMRIVPCKFKTPLASIDVSSFVPGTVTGIEFDADQNMWIKNSSNNIYRINLHTDVMTIDYDRKVIYLKENYDDVLVVTDD
jgi:hypothetical protein